MFSAYAEFVMQWRCKSEKNLIGIEEERRWLGGAGEGYGASVGPNRARPVMGLRWPP